VSDFEETLLDVTSSLTSGLFEAIKVLNVLSPIQSAVITALDLAYSAKFTQIEVGATGNYGQPIAGAVAAYPASLWAAETAEGYGYGYGGVVFASAAYALGAAALIKFEYQYLADNESNIITGLVQEGESPTQIGGVLLNVITNSASSTAASLLNLLSSEKGVFDQAVIDTSNQVSDYMTDIEAWGSQIAGTISTDVNAALNGIGQGIANASSYVSSVGSYVSQGIAGLEGLLGSAMSFVAGNPNDTTSASAEDQALNSYYISDAGSLSTDAETDLQVALSPDTGQATPLADGVTVTSYPDGTTSISTHGPVGTPSIGSITDTFDSDGLPISEMINNTNNTWDLTIYSLGSYSGTISAFVQGDTIDLAGNGTATGATLGANNVLTVIGGAVSPITLNLDPGQNFSNTGFILGSDGNGGTNITLGNPSAVFSSYSGIYNSNAVWETDGTVSGTKELTRYGVNPYDFTVFGSKVLFAGFDSNGYGEIDITDGTTTGTLKLADVTEPYGASQPVSNIITVGAGAVFTAYDVNDHLQLWATDGTVTGTKQLTTVTNSYPGGLSPTDFEAFGNKLLFIGYDANGNPGLWVTDGTTSGTQELTTISFNPYSSRGNVDLTVLGSSAVFLKNGELWSTDGSSGGTQQITQAPDAGLADLVAFGGEALFSGDGATGGNQLWITNGAANGTQELTPLAKNLGGVGQAQLLPQNITSLGSIAVLSGLDSSGSNRQLVATDGTAQGTTLLTAVTNNFSHGLNPSNFIVFGTKALFTGYDSTNNNELWVTDGTVAGTLELTNVAPYLLNPQNFTFIDGKALFTGIDATGHSELWVTDGTVVGTLELTTSANAAPANLTVLGGKVLFGANDSSGRTQLWITDGTAAGTLQLTSIANIYGGGVNLSDITVVGNEALFAGYDVNGNNQLWSTDGTVSGTQELTTNAVTPSAITSFPSISVLACYAAGTFIATPSGEVLVEDLRDGHSVATAFGGFTRVIWVGHRHVDCRRHPKPEQVWPVRVTAGAFGCGVPRRDLWLSPDHAVYVRDMLIPIKLLINGATVVQVPVVEMTYYHVELPQHDLLLAEGQPAESYLNVGDRTNFANSGPVMRLFPDFGTPSVNLATLWEAKGCAPLVIAGPELEASRAFVNAQAVTGAAAAWPLPASSAGVASRSRYEPFRGPASAQP